MSDLCQTPGCGHAKDEHFRPRAGCGHRDSFRSAYMSCPCTRYTAPTETTLAEALVACTHERWATITEGRKPKRWICLTCDTESETAFPSIAEQARRQVLADAQQAWAKWGVTRSTGAEALAGQPGFIAGYLAGKGITE